MKKKRLIILISALAIVIVALGYFTYIYITAVKDSLVDFYTSDESMVSLSRIPEHLEIGTDSKPGYTIHYQNYCLTLTGYDKVVINNDLNDNFRTLYLIDDDKSILFQNMDAYKNDFIFNSPAASSLIEEAAGKKITSEYGYMEASFYCTPKDFSLFDKNKNKGVSILLLDKSSKIGDTCYKFDNGTIRGFININSPEVEYVTFSNCCVPDSLYQIVFCNYSIEEVKGMLSTITFGSTNTN